MRFWKLSAIGNEFVLVHRDDEVKTDWPNLAINVCNRRTGVGSDGLLVMKGHQLQMFNPDGSEDFCGNGLRCAAVHGYAQGWLERQDSISHFNRMVRTWITGEDEAMVELPPATFDPAQVPVLAGSEVLMEEWHVAGAELTLSALSTGSTHVVMIGQEPTEEEFFTISEALEHDPRFPDRTSTMWATTLGPRDLKLRPFERGAGETRGCGTGSAAVAIVHSRLSGVTGQINIHNTGGIVAVHLEDWQGPIRLSSKVKTHFSGVLDRAMIPTTLPTKSV